MDIPGSTSSRPAPQVLVRSEPAGQAVAVPPTHMYRNRLTRRCHARTAPPPADRDRRGWIRWVPRRSDPEPIGQAPRPAAGRRDRDRADQRDRLFPVPAAAARGGRRRAGSAPGGRAAARSCPAARLLVGTAEQIDLRGRRVSVAGPKAIAASCPTTGCCSPRAASTSCCPFPASPSTATGSAASPRRSTFVTTSCASSSWPPAATTPNGKPAAPLWWSAPVTPAPRSRRTASYSPAPRPAGTPACAVSGSAGYCSTRPRTCCPNWTARLSAAAHRTLTRRGVEIRTGTTVTEATSGGVRLSDGQFVPTRSLIWCVGVRPDPLVAQLGLPTTNGRLNVDEYLTVPGHPDVAACGDIAAVPDLTRPGQLTPMTAQHAERQGRLAARNIAASLGYGHRRAYRHHDLGFVVDLGGAAAAANPLGVPLSGLPAKAVTRGYHLAAIPANRVRIAVRMAARCCPAPAGRPVRAGARRRRPARCCRREPPVRAPARRGCTVEANSRRPATRAARHLGARKRRGRFHRMGTFGCGLAGDLFLACRVKDTPTLRRNGNDCCQLSPVCDWLGRRTGWTTARTSPRYRRCLPGARAWAARRHTSGEDLGNTGNARGSARGAGIRPPARRPPFPRASHP